MARDSISNGAIRSNSLEEAVKLVRDDYRVLLTNFTGASHIEGNSEYGFRVEIVHKFIDSLVDDGFYLYVTPIEIRKNDAGREHIYPSMSDHSEIRLGMEKANAINLVTEDELIHIFALLSD